MHVYSSCALVTMYCPFKLEGYLHRNKHHRRSSIAPLASWMRRRTSSPGTVGGSSPPGGDHAGPAWPWECAGAIIVMSTLPGTRSPKTAQRLNIVPHPRDRVRTCQVLLHKSKMISAGLEPAIPGSVGISIGPRDQVMIVQDATHITESPRIRSRVSFSWHLADWISELLLEKKSDSGLPLQTVSEHVLAGCM